MFKVNNKNSRTTPAGIYLLKVRNRNTRTRCQLCLKLTVKIPERCQPVFTCSKLTIETLEQGVKYVQSVSIVNFDQVNAGWSYFSSTALFIYSDTSSFVSTLKYEMLFRRIDNIKLVLVKTLVKIEFIYTLLVCQFLLFISFFVCFN